eukprot:TRINITY_DN256_c0_g1_i1.p1 TRINITY_DN256_c0_g1~~TRINITY_DN256_c0_g1_i1.p1  ORF type:complete len:674 (+),score=136.98 TRINITY_DN256_c0_g1_i1:654-2675(+)
MLRLAVSATLLSVVPAFLQPTHSCGDSQSRLHLRSSCKYALYQLDQLVPDMDAALDEHNRRNFRDVLKHPETIAARKSVQDCFACVLAGNSNCDVKPRDTGDHSLHKVAKEWHGVETGLSQNCRDHMESRAAQSTNFKPSDLHVHDSVSLMEAPEVKTAAPRLSMMPRILADANAIAGSSSDTTSLSANDPTLGQERVGKLYDTDASPDVHATNELIQETRRELAEPEQDTFICAQIDHNLAGEISCPDGQRITSIEFASYGTPNNADYKLDANITDTTFTTLRNGVKIFSGDKCFNMDYAQRGECNAYNSRDLVDKICHGATRCTLSAVGDKKKLMSFQPLICDLKLKLYVKARCGKQEVTDALGRTTLASKEITSLMGVAVDEVHRTATIDLTNPDHSEFRPGQMPIISLAEIETGARPIVRAPIDPPAEFYNAFALKGEGRMCFKCGYTGLSDEDGMIYYWRPCDEEPKLSYVNLSPISGTEGVQATWNGESNTYVSSKDGSFVKPEDTPTGLVSDYSMDQTSKTPVVNAPDFLYHIVSASSSGVFAGVQYVQRFQTTNGMPPNSNGNIVVNGVTYNKCNAAQARDNVAAEVPISATYVFYKERESGAAPAPAGVPAWGILLIVCGALLLVAIVVLAVLGKVPGFKRHSEDSDETEQEHLADNDQEENEL